MANFGHCTTVTTVNVWEIIGEKILSTILHSTWERGRVNLIFTPRLGWDVSKVMGHVSLCVCDSCYSSLRLCYSQIMAIAPLQSMYGRE